MKLYIAALVGTAAARGPFQLPFIGDIPDFINGQAFGRMFPQWNVRPFGPYPGNDSEQMTGQQQPPPPPQPVYETNERGQFLTLESYARAMTDQMGIPYPVAKRIAELNRSFGRQLIMLNTAVADWLGQVESGLPDPAAFGEPIVIGLDAASSAIQAPGMQAAMPVITGMVDLMLTGLSTAFRLPTDAFIEAPRNEIASLNELVEALSPVALDEPAPTPPAATNFYENDTQAEAN